MNVPDDVLRGIGGISVESVWLEVVAASMYARGLDEAIQIMATPGEALKAAQRAINNAADPMLRSDAQEWLKAARGLLRDVRHPIVHGLAHYDQDGQWHSVHAKTGDVRPLVAAELEDHRQRMDAHAGLGWGIAARFWENGPADSLRTDEASK